MDHFSFIEVSISEIEKELMELRDGYVPDELKRADITPVFKKDDPIKVKNYRPVKVLP